MPDELKITMQEAFDFADKQLDSKTPAIMRKGSQWHYGRVELGELICKIYGKLPDRAQLINRKDTRRTAEECDKLIDMVQNA